MVISIFRSRLRAEFTDEFHAHAESLMKLAERMPGFISYRLYLSADGERCSIVEFESHEKLLAWRNLPEHQAAQKLGRERYFETYSLQVTEPIREARFSR